MKAEESFPIQPLSLEDFPKLDFDVYIRIADKFILYFRRGEFVDEARLDRLIQKKLKQLFLAKSDEAKSRIKQKLTQSFMFANLDEKEQNIVIGAIEEVKVQEGEKVIVEGQEGDCLYIVDDG